MHSLDRDHWLEQELLEPRLYQDPLLVDREAREEADAESSFLKELGSGRMVCGYMIHLMGLRAKG